MSTCKTLPRYGVAELIALAAALMAPARDAFGELASIILRPKKPAGRPVPTPTPAQPVAPPAPVVPQPDLPKERPSYPPPEPSKNVTPEEHPAEDEWNPTPDELTPEPDDDDTGGFPAPYTEPLYERRGSGKATRYVPAGPDVAGQLFRKVAGKGRAKYLPAAA